MNLEKYKYKTEFHLHTSPASRCSEIAPELAIKLYAEKGYHSVVITNHFYSSMQHFDQKAKCIEAYLEDYRRAVEAGKQYGIHVILGCELSTQENWNDYLLLGVEKDTLDLAYEAITKGIAWFSQKFRSENTLLIQAHPFRNNMTPIDPTLLDGFETFNLHPNHNSRVALAAKYAKEHNLIPTVGTDYHHPGHEGLSALLTETQMKTSDDLVNTLRSGNYIFEIGGSLVIP